MNCTLRLRYFFESSFTYLGYFQLEDLKLLPEKAEKEVECLEKKKEKLEKEKEKEEEKLAEVMESLKTETAGLQEEKEGKERELVELQKAVNETKSVVCILSFYSNITGTPPT